LRVATTARSPEARLAAIRAVEQALSDAHIGVESAIPLAEHRTAIGDHILILVQALMALAVILAIVGTLGLASTVGISVVERTREFGVMKTIGATPGRLVRMIMAEALFIAAGSWILAVLLSVPVTVLVGWLVGTLGFLAPLPLVFASAPALLWLVLVGSVAPAAALLPARRASHLTVQAALAHP